ncbi:bifunctional UDP-sugar hydrolase/5'-nucleotidase UshA [Aliamphritea hakodatensis]|uniref:bifunctional UDP-sugar hydrolase/5'-nucleotidase UshA n=1 Tax=Aliamphritea hakodatensis TaxID=2895352 RepID=UPI0022FD919B|nr:bifunctional UDP-sugar hydrolase/5'-nucleotidase UshA [Aliamphritea hakodatensis]
MFRLKAAIAGGLVSVALSGCAFTGAQQEADWQAGKEYRLTVLHTNDHHGRFWSNRHGEYGMAARKTLIDRIRAEVAAQGGELLLLSGGDINTGVPESDLQDAEPDFKGMSRIGYDAMAVGNHEFDNPLGVLREQQAWADFPFLAANIYEQDSGERLFEPYRIFNRGDLKIAVLGLTTKDTAKLGNPEFISDIRFTDPVAEAASLVPELQDQADVVIAATHMGHYVDAAYGINAPGDVTMARQVDGLDMIIGGHSQDPVCMAADGTAVNGFRPGDACMPDVQNGTLIMQAHEWGKYVGRADLVFKDGELRLESYQLIPVNLKKKVKGADGKKVRMLVADAIAEDAGLKAFLQPYQEQGQAQLQIKIGEVDAKLEGDRGAIRFQPTNLGVLIAQAQMDKTQSDLAVMNSGGVRDSIAAGDITYKDVLKVQPFANAVAFVELSGAELLDYLAVVAEKPVDSGAFAQFAGVQLEVVGGKLDKVLVAGQPVDPAGTYRMAINSYIASGGDGYPKMDDHPGYVNTGFVDAEVLRTYLEVNSPLSAARFDSADIIRR